MEILDPLNCKICGHQSKNLIAHIRIKHGYNTKEYKEKYPDAKLVYISEEQKIIAREKTRKWLSDEENVKNLNSKRKSIWQKSFWIEKGLTEVEAIAKISSLQKRTFTEETRKLYSKQRTGDANSMSLESIAKRNGCSPQEAIALTPCFGRKKEKHPMYGKHHTPEAIIKICLNTPTSFFNKSKGEKELQLFVLSLDTDAKFNRGAGPYNCDIILKTRKIVIEYFGDYWHCNPSKFAADDYNKRLHCTASERWKKDELKKNYFEKLGFKYIVVWEDCWKNNKETIKENIKCIMNL